MVISYTRCHFVRAKASRDAQVKFLKLRWDLSFFFFGQLKVEIKGLIFIFSVGTGPQWQSASFHPKKASPTLGRLVGSAVHAGSHGLDEESKQRNLHGKSMRRVSSF